jgi:Spy/CpxP family protein refolding chaperone
MKPTLLAAISAAAAFALMPAPARAKSGAAPLYDPVGLNIGLLCQWQWQCMQQQNKAMDRALKFVRKKRPPTWRIETCNKNASRKRQRVDWVGYDHCIRNPALLPAPRRRR